MPTHWAGLVLWQNCSFDCKWSEQFACCEPDLAGYPQKEERLRISQFGLIVVENSLN